MREKAIEAQLVQATKHRSGLALKFTSPGMAGVPDRILLMPGGRAAFAGSVVTVKCFLSSFAPTTP